MQFYNEIKWIYSNYNLKSSISFIIDVISLLQTLNKLEQQEKIKANQIKISKNVLKYDLIVMLRVFVVDKYCLRAKQADILNILAQNFESV